MLLLLLVMAFQEPSSTQVEAWIQQLKEDDVSIREAALKKLMDAGPSILPILRKHATTGEAELRARINDVIRRLTRWEPEGSFSYARRALQKDSKAEDWRPALKSQLTLLMDEIGDDGAPTSLSGAKDSFRECFKEENAVVRAMQEKMEKVAAVVSAAKHDRLDHVLLASESADLGDVRDSVVVCTGEVKIRKLYRSILLGSGKVSVLEIESSIVFSGGDLSCNRRLRDGTLLALGKTSMEWAVNTVFLNPAERIGTTIDCRDVKKPRLPAPKP